MKNLLLWGHSLKDYKEIFSLSTEDLTNKKIIDCGSGPAIFNFDMKMLGNKIVSIDSLYAKNDIISIVKKKFKHLCEDIKGDNDKFNWHNYKNIDDLIKNRNNNLEQFFNDFSIGVNEQRYWKCDISNISAADNSFDLALCLNNLFTLSADKGLDYHLKSIREMARVAKAVKIFPLISKSGDISPYIGPILLALQKENYAAEVTEAKFSLHKKANAMLYVKSLSCDVM